MSRAGDKAGSKSAYRRHEYPAYGIKAVRNYKHKSKASKKNK